MLFSNCLMKEKREENIGLRNIKEHQRIWEHTTQHNFKKAIVQKGNKILWNYSHLKIFKYRGKH